MLLLKLMAYLGPEEGVITFWMLAYSSLYPLPADIVVVF